MAAPPVVAEGLRAAAEVTYSPIGWADSKPITGDDWLRTNVNNPDIWLTRTIHLDPMAERLEQIIRKDARFGYQGGYQGVVDARSADQHPNFGAWISGWCGLDWVENYLFSSRRRPGPYAKRASIDPMWGSRIPPEPDDPADELFGILCMKPVADTGRAGDGGQLHGRHLDIRWVDSDRCQQILRSDLIERDKWAARFR